jgi:hypothetical protein
VAELSIGDIGIGNILTLATFNKCFGFTALDKSNIPAILAKI